MTQTAKPKKILVIEDEKEIRDFVIEVLQKEGYAVAGASNGKEALRILEKITPHLILLDVTMPVMGGLEFCRHIVGSKGNIPIPILVLTARAELESVFQAMNVYKFLSKPFQVKELVTAVHQIVDEDKPSKDILK